MKVLILMYHMVLDTAHSLQKRYAVSPAKFKRQMQYLKFFGYTPISLDDLYMNLQNKDGKLPEKPIVITFDDGYMDNYENAVPVLQEYDFPAAIFMVSGLVGTSNKWDISNGYPEETLMGWRELQDAVKVGITVGSHTVNHPRLTQLVSDDAKKEIEGSKKFLEDGLGMPINHFCYPYGDLSEPIVGMVRESGYETACSVRSGFNMNNTDPHILKRIGIFGEDSLLRFASKVTFGTNDGKITHTARYYLSRLVDRIR